MRSPQPLVLWLPSELEGLKLTYKPGEVHKKVFRSSRGCVQSSRQHVSPSVTTLPQAILSIWSPGGARCNLLAVVRSG